MRTLKEQKELVDSIKSELTGVLIEHKIQSLQPKLIRNLSHLIELSNKHNIQSELVKTIDQYKLVHVKNNTDFYNNIVELRGKIENIKKRYVEEHINLLMLKNKRMSDFADRLKDFRVKVTNSRSLFWVSEALSGSISISSFELLRGFGNIRVPLKTEEKNYIHIKTSKDDFIWFYNPQTKELIQCYLTEK